MDTFKRIALCVLSFLFVSACQHDGKELERKPWETKVERYSHFENFYFTSSQTHMNSAQHKVLRNLISRATIDTPVYARLLMNVPKTRAHDSLQTERIRHCSRHFRLYGIEPHRVRVTYLAPHKVATISRKNKNMITVVIDQYEVSLPQCPGWDIMGEKTLPQGESQFGCVTERNFAQMLAEPRDLYEAQPLANPDGPYNAAVIEKYRARATTDNESESGFDAGSIQDLANLGASSE